MAPQYVAGRSSSTGAFEASRSQPRRAAACGYLLAPSSPMLRGRHTQVRLTSRGPRHASFGAGTDHNCDRRRRCPRASRSWPCSALHSQRPHAHVKHRSKSLLWLIPHRSLSSQHTQASTSNLVFVDLSRQAFAPVSSRLRTCAAADVPAPHQGPEATWH